MVLFLITILWKTLDLANRRLCDHKEIENKHKRNYQTNNKVVTQNNDNGYDILSLHD